MYVHKEACMYTTLATTWTHKLGWLVMGCRTEADNAMSKWFWPSLISYTPIQVQEHCKQFSCMSTDQQNNELV